MTSEKRQTESKLDIREIQKRIDLIKSILISHPELEPELRAKYQKEYRTLKQKKEYYEQFKI